MTNSQILQHLSSLHAVADARGGARFAYAVAKNHSALSKAIEPCMEARKKLIEQAEKTEDGQKLADADAVNAEIEALLAEEAEDVRTRSISPHELPDGLTPAQVAGLDWMIEEVE